MALVSRIVLEAVENLVRDNRSDEVTSAVDVTHPQRSTKRENM